MSARIEQPGPKERPILFSGEMVRAILEGRKTQTRRVVKHNLVVPPQEFRVANGPLWWRWFSEPNTGLIRSPYGQPGDRLWVRETWQAVHFSKDFETGYVDDIYEAKVIPKSDDDGWWSPQYAADKHHQNHPEDRGFGWRPSIHMPRWASRITLEVTSIRVERLQDISEEDARTEGVKPDEESSLYTYRDAFSFLWESLNAARGYSWESNPFVWVVEFRRCS